MKQKIKRLINAPTVCDTKKERPICLAGEAATTITTINTSGDCSRVTATTHTHVVCLCMCACVRVKRAVRCTANARESDDDDDDDVEGKYNESLYHNDIQTLLLMLIFLDVFAAAVAVLFISSH